MPILVSALWCLSAASSSIGAPQGDRPVDFARDVRPILSDNCFHCHGPDPETRKSGLRLDTREGVLAALATGGHAVVAGDPDESELVARIAPMFEEDVMPPERSGKSLQPDEIATLTRWIAEGAAWGDHWSFEAPELAELPSQDASPIDAFVARTLGAAGLSLQAEADPYTLLRRASLDLTGLPPTRQERDAFLKRIEDEGLDAAYELEVDRLIASSRYGVHMARTWLDAARYADTHGLHLDNRRSMWPYRDWVVRALNSNMPFDQFTVEQLAGDLLDDPTPDQVIASGFNRCNPTSAEGGMIAAEYLSIYAKDRADTTATVWMGLTLACAQCHDHKFDPLTQRDYYSMYAFFNSLDEEATDRNIENPKPFARTMDEESRARFSELEDRYKRVNAALAVPAPELEARADEWVDRQSAELASRWRVATPTSAESTGGTVLTVDPRTGIVDAGGENAEKPVYELMVDVPTGVVEGLRLDALVPEGRTLPGRAVNENFVMTFLEVDAAPLDGSKAWSRVEWRTAVASHSQSGYDIANVLDPSAENGWAGLGLDGPRSALFLPAMRFGYPGGTRVRVRLRFESVHVAHAFARFRLAVGVDEEGPARPGMSAWWHASFPTKDRAGLFERAFDPERQLAAGLDVLGEAAPAVAWVPEPAFVSGVVHPLPSGLGSHYLVKRLVTEEPGHYQLRLGSDDGNVVWLNGEEVARNNVGRAAALDQDLVPLALKAGSNELVVKVVNTGGAAGFAWRLWDATGDDEIDPGILLALMVAPTGEAADSEELARIARRATDPAWLALDDERISVKASLDTFNESLPTTLVSAELEMRRPAHMQMRGAYDHLGDVVPPATPGVLPPLSEEAPKNRLGLARWLVAREHPLTARVWVNRAWQHFFGRGIVSTPEDFGSQGAWPSHPELLDWLAVTFMDEGWDMKSMHRRIALSKTYRQSSKLTPERDAIDPDGQLISRGPRYRLDGEVLRDQALFLAGLLNEDMGGPGVRPYQPDGVWFAVGYTRSNTVRYTVGSEDEQRRRSLYTFWKRTAPPPNLTTFDAPMRDTCTVQRERTNTPLQALVTLNDPTYVEAAEFIARRVLASSTAGREEIAADLFDHVVGRPANADEIEALVALANYATETFEADPAAAAALEKVGMIEVNEPLETTESVAAWTIVASALLNLDEVLTND